MGIQSDVVNLFQHKELVKGFGLLDNTIRLSQSVVQPFTTMISAAEKDGVRHFMINSGYRDNKEQSQLYKEMGADYALPAGYSEHNLGLALDIGSTQGEMNQAPEGNWLTKNAWNIRVYFTLSQGQNGHHRHPVRTLAFSLCWFAAQCDYAAKEFILEQYLDYLKQQKTISTTVDDQTMRSLIILSPKSQPSMCQLIVAIRYQATIWTASL